MKAMIISKSGLFVREDVLIYTDPDVDTEDTAFQLEGLINEFREDSDAVLLSEEAFQLLKGYLQRKQATDERLSNLRRLLDEERRWTLNRMVCEACAATSKMDTPEAVSRAIDEFLTSEETSEVRLRIEALEHRVGVGQLTTEPGGKKIEGGDFSEINLRGLDLRGIEFVNCKFGRM